MKVYFNQEAASHSSLSVSGRAGMNECIFGDTWWMAKATGSDIKESECGQANSLHTIEYTPFLLYRLGHPFYKQKSSRSLPVVQDK